VRQYRYRFERETMCRLENLALSRGFTRIAGIDEAGRGALAGPVVAACVILDGKRIPPGVADSKKLSDRRRRDLCAKIRESAVAIGIGAVEPATIDEINILNATKVAMKLAVAGAAVRPDFLLIDAVKLYDISISSLSFCKGEDKSVSVAAASIVAKVHRDDLMIRLSDMYPGFGFAEHKGYGTARHTEALREIGLTDIHRYSYRPVSEAQSLWKSKRQR
jgi:ribonuclease HII